MSLLNKKWEIINQFDYLSFQEKLYRNRGLASIDSLETFLYPSLEKNLHSPLKLKGMLEAVARIKQAIKAQERIVVFGDYDVDGVTATYLLFNFLKKIGAQVSYRIPHRVDEGYGLKNEVIDELAQKGVSLIITVDCGIGNYKEIDYAANQGIEVVITDHHTPPLNLPQAFAVINPKQINCNYPFKELAGVGVVYKLVSVLADEFWNAAEAKQYLASILDLVALGTIADCMPLVDENRVIVKFGLECLAKTQNPGLKALLQNAGLQADKINAETVAFILAPRLNVAGRLQHAYYSFDLLMGKTEVAALLDKWNKQRQTLVDNFMAEIEKKLQTEETGKNYILLKDKRWHAGIIGLIAGKLAEKYGYPAIVIEERSDKFIGSCRSIESINLYQILQQASDLFIHFGGHSQAAGFSMTPDKYPEFEDRLNFILQREGKRIDFRPALKIECVIRPEDISWKNLEFIETLAPFGAGNELPKFLLKNVTPLDLHLTGKNGGHLKFNLQTPLGKIKVIGFNHSFMYEHLETGKPVDFVFQMERNNWNDKESIQLKLVDLKVA